MGIKEIIKERSGIHLDIGCGESKQSHFVGMDVRKLAGVDLVWDWANIPYPIPDDTCISILASHVVEHVNPADFGFIKVMDEWHRITKPGGRLMISTPYPGSSGYWQDPTHVNGVSERTLAYFDPEDKSGLWRIYKPRPWKIIQSAWASIGNLEAVLEKRI